VLWLVALLLIRAPDGPSVAVVDRVAATVDDVAIPESAVRRAMAMSALRAGPGEAAESFRLRVLEAMIDQHLQYDDAVRFGPAPPDPADVTAAVQKVRERLKSEGRDPDKEFEAAGLKPEELRSALERQLIVQRHLSERFRPLSISDAQRAREEYDQHYVPESRAKGQAPAPFETVAEEMRVRSQQRVFDEEVEKWMRELRARARIAIYRLPPPYPEGAKPVVLSTTTPEKSPKSKVQSPK
jgi:parvulin-like peptidyl-prolyl isomerase